MNIDPKEWQGSTVGSECTFHQISPYIGKMKSSMAKAIINTYSKPDDIILDPFVGSGAIALEAIINGRKIICNDINPYAVTLTLAKLSAPTTLKEAIENANVAFDAASTYSSTCLTEIPEWVKSFFHPKTLQEILQFLKFTKKRDPFLTACLLGILHHQRPGFLSYPASHLVPYLRSKKFPKENFPELYDYRSLKPRLIKKIERTYRRPPVIKKSILKKCFNSSFQKLELESQSIDTIITSPPYMDALDYGRDNRLRLWFLGVNDYSTCIPKTRTLDGFIPIMNDFISRANNWLRDDGYCVCVVGEVNRKNHSIDIAKIIADIATKKCGNFELESIITDAIPNIRRARKGSYIKTESIVVLKRKRRGKNS